MRVPMAWGLHPTLGNFNTGYTGRGHLTVSTRCIIFPTRGGVDGEANSGLLQGKSFPSEGTLGLNLV